MQHFSFTCVYLPREKMTSYVTLVVWDPSLWDCKQEEVRKNLVCYFENSLKLLWSKFRSGIKILSCFFFHFLLKNESGVQVLLFFHICPKIGREINLKSYSKTRPPKVAFSLLTSIRGLQPWGSHSPWALGQSLWARQTTVQFISRDSLLPLLCLSHSYDVWCNSAM